MQGPLAQSILLALVPTKACARAFAAHARVFALRAPVRTMDARGLEAGAPVRVPCDRDSGTGAWEEGSNSRVFAAYSRELATNSRAWLKPGCVGDDEGEEY